LHRAERLERVYRKRLPHRELWPRRSWSWWRLGRLGLSWTDVLRNRPVVEWESSRGFGPKTCFYISCVFSVFDIFTVFHPCIDRSICNRSFFFLATSYRCLNYLTVSIQYMYAQVFFLLFFCYVFLTHHIIRKSYYWFFNIFVACTFSDRL